jgi:hypothetical protein
MALDMADLMVAMITMPVASGCWSNGHQFCGGGGCHDSNVLELRHIQSPQSGPQFVIRLLNARWSHLAACVQDKH